MTRATGGISAVARVLMLHPALRPRPYLDTAVDVDEPGARVRVTLSPCDALGEGDDLTWAALLVRHDTRALDAIVQSVDPRARTERLADAPDGGASWVATVDSSADPARELDEVVLTSFTTGADFVFRDAR